MAAPAAEDKPGEHSKTMHVLNALISGSISGMVVKSMTAPLDRVKIIYQASSKPFSYKKGLKTAEKIVADTGAEFLKLFLIIATIYLFIFLGWKGLWRGNTASMLRVAPYAAIQFTVHEQLTIWFNVRTYEQIVESPVLGFLAGALGGGAAITATYPLDVIRARLITDQSYRGIGHVIRRALHPKMKAREARKYSLFRGYTAAIVGNVPYTGVSFLIYELFKMSYFVQAATSKNQLVLAVEYTVLGFTVSLLGQTLIYPFDVLRRRMQANVKEDLKMRQLAVAIAEQEGLRGFFKGVSLSWFKLPVVMGSSMVCFDLVYQLLNKYGS